MSGAIGHWWGQRISSVLLIPLSLWLLYAGATLAGADYQAANEFMGNWINAAAAVALAAIGLYHAQSGIQVIVEDYVPGKAFPLALVWITRIGCLLGVLAVVAVVFKLLFGA